MEKTLTVIVPIHNEEANVAPFYERARSVLEGMGLEWEMLFVNDGSSDGSLNEILRIRDKDKKVKVVSLSRNFGYHAGLVAGLTTRASDLYVITDVDGEDPPELWTKFHTEIKNGAYTAYGDRSRRDEPAWLIFWRWLFYWINRRIADAPIRLWMAEFSMFRRTVRDAILKNRTTFPFLRAELGFVGFKMVGVPYFRASRRRGASHYNFYSMMKFAVAGFLSSSTFPLRGILYLSASLGAAYLAGLAACRPSLAVAADWAQILTFVFLLASLPMIALYLARTYKDVSGRPVYFIDPEGTSLD